VDAVDTFVRFLEEHNSTIRSPASKVFFPLVASSVSFRTATAFLGRSINPHHTLNKYTHLKIQSRLKMGWSDTWSDILDGGSQRWKVTDEESHMKVFSHFQTFVQKDPSDTHVLCPLAGDDPFVYLLFSQGYSVSAIDLVPEAIEELKITFKCSSEEDWKKEESDNSLVWKHASGRATFIVGDALQKRPELVGKFDAVYDKDSFGALPKSLRKGFCARISEFTKKGGLIYLECKLKNNHEEVVNVGPPFSLKAENLMEEDNFGANFDYVKGLGSVYDLSVGMVANMQQTGHVMKRN